MDCCIEGEDPPELVARDVLGSVLRVGVPGWEPDAEADGEWGDLVQTGRAAGLHLPAVAVMVDVDGTIQDTVTVGIDSYEIDAPVTLRVDAAVRARILIPDGRVRLEPTELRDGIRVRLSEPTWMRFAFQTRAPTETKEVVVSADAEGLAEAMSTGHRTITDRSPDRTWPTQRPRTATVTIGGDRSVPSSLAEPADPAVEIHTPPSLAAMVPLTSVAAYLGASVSIAAGDVRILAGDTVWRITPPGERTGGEPQRSYERAVHGQLERAFWLDCLAREAGDVADEHRRSGVLDEHGLSADRLYDASMADRLAAYDTVPVAAVRETFPDWHYAISARPSIDAIESIGHRLHQLPLVHVADGEHLTEVDVVSRALDENRRGPYTSDPKIIEPNSTPARTHAWAGDGVPIGGWKLADGPGTRKPSHTGDDPLRVVVVLTDSSMADEQAGASDHYGRRSDDLGIEVETVRNPTPVELAGILEGDADLVHYVGHHDAGSGLRCYGGHLSTSELSSTDVRTFFINACGSYPFGEAMIANGAEAGVVTTTAVVEKAATGLGVTWSRLLTYGWPVVSALEYARSVDDRPLLDYVVIGDGTTTLTQSDVHVPAKIEIDQIGQDLWRTTMIHDLPIYHGTQTTTPLYDDWWLPGHGNTKEVSTVELQRFSDRMDNPATIKGEIRWPEEQEWDSDASRNL